MNVSQPQSYPAPQNPWILASRPKTLLIAVAPVLTGSTIAYQHGLFQWIPALLCLLFALLVQIGCNYVNDCYDFLSGVDTDKRVGFKRATASGLITPDEMKMGIIIVFSLAFLVGSPLIFFSELWLLILPPICIAAAFAYTGGPFPIVTHGLGDIFVFIFFGLVGTMFTFYVQTGYFSLESFLAASAIGLLAANVRAVNDTRDIETDAAAGRRTWAIRFGKPFCYAQYTFSYAIALAIPIILTIQGYNSNILLPLATLPLGIYLIRKFINAQSGQDYNDTLSRSAILLLLYSILLSIGFAMN